MSAISIRALGSGLLLVLLSGCFDAPAALPDEDGLLEALMEEYVAARFRFYPVEATLAGLPGNDERLGSFSSADLARRIRWLSDFHNKLMGLDLAALSQPAYLDALWLRSLVKAELFDLEERRLPELSPAFYGDFIREGLLALLAARDVASRSDILQQRLEAIPSLVDQARENLGAIPDASRRHGLRSFLLCRDLLDDMPLLLEERFPSYRVAELAEESRLATRSLQLLVSRLSQETASSRSTEAGHGILGEEGTARFFLYREMIDWTPDRILLEAEEAMARATHELTELALDTSPDLPLSVVLAPPSGPPVQSEELASSYEEKVRSFLARAGIGHAPDGPVGVHAVPAYFIAPFVVRLWRPASLAPAREAKLLLAGGLPGAPELELAVLSEIASRYRQYALQAESPSLLRRVFQTRTTSEGFSAWFVSRLLDRGYGDPGAELRLRHLRNTRLAALRLVLALRMHAFGASWAETERSLRELGRLSKERAAEEADRIAADPGAGSAALGRLLLEELERDYRRAHPLADPRALEDAVLSEGLVPLRLVRFKLLGIESN